MGITRLGAVCASAVAVALVSVAVGGSPALAATTTTGSLTVKAPIGTVFSGVSRPVVSRPNRPATATYDSAAAAVAVTFPVSGGDADLTALTGELTYSGSLTVFNSRNGTCVTLGGLVLDLRAAEILATAPDGTTIGLFDLQPEIDYTAGTPNTLSTQSTTLDADAASYLDTKLNSTAFTAGQPVGSFSTTWTIAAS